jgi:hypothetical protein
VARRASATSRAAAMRAPRRGVRRPLCLAEILPPPHAAGCATTWSPVPLAPSGGASVTPCPSAKTLMGSGCVVGHAPGEWCVGRVSTAVRALPPVSAGLPSCPPPPAAGSAPTAPSALRSLAAIPARACSPTTRASSRRRPRAAGRALPGRLAYLAGNSFPARAPCRRWAFSNAAQPPPASLPGRLEHCALALLDGDYRPP